MPDQLQHSVYVCVILKDTEHEFLIIDDSAKNSVELHHTTTRSYLRRVHEKTTPINVKWTLRTDVHILQQVLNILTAHGHGAWMTCY